MEIASSRGAAFCAKQLAELGARVVKLERPGGSSIRFDEPSIPGHAGQVSAAHLYLDTAKESLVVDLAWSGADGLTDLASRFDVVVHGCERDLAATLGLLPHQSLGNGGSVIMVSVTPFGLDGPFASLPATEMTVAAAGGYMHGSGYSDRDPLTFFGHQLEASGGAVATIGALAALAARDRGDSPGCVDVALIEVAPSMLDAWLIAGYSLHGQDLHRRGSRTGPVDILKTSDGFVHAHPLNQLQWERFALVIERPDILDDPRLQTQALANANYPAAMEYAAPWFEAHTSAEAFAALQELRIPSSLSQTFAELRNDVQVQARGIFRELDHPSTGTLHYPAQPFTSDAIALRFERAPDLGAHQPLPEVRIAQTRTPSSGRPPLEGVRIVDLTQVWAGPFATEMLAEMGADVIHIESNRRLDMTRWWSVADDADGPAWEKAASFMQPNRSKRSLVLNLNHPDARDVFRDLVRVSDILINNYATRVMGNWGFGYEAMLEVNPRLIYLTMPAFGATGPYRDFISTGDIMEGAAGLVRHNGYGPDEPCRSGTALCDPYGSFGAATLILAALRNRDAHGLPAYIDLCQRDASLRFIGEEWLAFEMTGVAPDQWHNHHRDYFPHGAFPAAGEDRWVAIAVRDAKEWRALCGAMRRTDLAREERDSTDARRAGAAEIEAAITRWTGQREAHWIETHLLHAGVPAGVVRAASEFFDHPQLVHRGFLPWVDHPVTGPSRLHAMPVYFPAMPSTRTARRAPLFDEHTDVILLDVLGYAPDDVHRLRSDGAIGGEPIIG